MEISNIKKISIKFFFSNALAGLLIGNGGKSIKELIEVSDARVNVSGMNEVYPGTNDRVVVLTGSLEAVSLAQTLIWEMLSQISKEGNNRPKNIEWSPKVAVGSLGQNYDIPVSAKIAIPAASGGLILGRGGSTIKGIAEESGAKVSMTNKEEAIFTHERIISIDGDAGACIKCTDMILAKLNEQDEIESFVNRGTSYASPLQSQFGMNGMGRPGSNGGRGRGDSRKLDGKGKHFEENEESAVDSAISKTTITLTIPDELVGHILGRQGSTMREIISLSGADVKVSARGTFAEGTTDRIVTITGSPVATQSAHLFINQKMQASQMRQQNNQNGRSAVMG